ncbi:diguanylate cyclase [Alteromonas sp. A079]|uniref:GGDEF domain-containing protein n=1 Tax=Alteromonas sp. A079 TaxID=3410268 RepID=UPI003BA0C635
MVQSLSVPLFITASICLLLSVFFILLYHRLTSRHEESVKYYFIFSLAAFVSSVFFGGFAMLLNSADNLLQLSIANRITVVAAMFTTVLSLHFYVSFYQYRAPTFLKWCYVICAAFSLLAVVPNQYFLANTFFETSQYYTGLAYGPLFQLWGGWILVLAAYCIFILIRVFTRQRRRQGNSKKNTVLLLLIANIIWTITGVCDALTGIQVIDLPPLTWIGSFLITSCIAWVLVLHIDNLYEERRLLNNRLMHDHLTQAFSRSYLEIRLNEAVNLMIRGKLQQVSVCVFDVDNFKTINDEYGHANGDALLVKITKIIKENIRQSDCIARLGGDEFVILFTDEQNSNFAPIIVERIRKCIAETQFGEGAQMFNASCSFGIVSVAPDQLTMNDLANQMLSSADEALYSAKHQGKNAIGITTLCDLS